MSVVGTGALSLLDWRRRVNELYADVRRISSEDPCDAHRVWRERRDDLFASHEQSPVPDRAAFNGLTYFPYDAAWRTEVEVETAPPQRLTVQSGTGEDFDLDRLGIVTIPGGTKCTGSTSTAEVSSCPCTI
jgi:uncharacterized protein